jgi:HAD superfamily hydrolase (TIGR01509 family)
MTPTAGAALLFDIDGTLADTDRLHLDAFNRVFAPFAEPFSPERFKAELQGFSNTAIAARFLPAETAERQREILDEKEAAFRSLASTGLEPTPGLIALLDRADAAGLRYAAVTNAPRANADLILDALGIKHRFRVIVLGDELPHGKPHPLPYLEGLRLLGGNAVTALAFEDSPSGVRSATAAGIATVGMLTGQSEATLRQAGAVAVAGDYTDLGLLELLATITAK